MSAENIDGWMDGWLRVRESFIPKPKEASFIGL